MADVVYVTSRPVTNAVPPAGGGPNLDLNANFDTIYTEENLILGDTGAKSTVSDAPPRNGSRAYLGGTSLTNTTAGFALRPDLGTPGGLYLLEHSLSANAGNVSTDVILSVSSTNAGLSTSQTTVFQAAGGNTWETIGYVTNNPGVAIPHLEFRYQSGLVNAGSDSRLVVDVFRFSEVVPCLDVLVPTVQGPLATNISEVAVTGVTSNATAVAVYQDSGSGMVKVGELTSGVVSNLNLVPVTGLVKNAQVSATQTVGGQESCVQPSGLLVGGGANPSIRVVLSIRETSQTGPVGAVGSTASANLHFLGATFRIGSAPGDGLVVNPSNEWQTLTFDADFQPVIGNVSGAVGAAFQGGSYAPNDSIQVQVYALTNDPVSFSNFYSQAGATTATVTSNSAFGVNWTWDPVSGAQGYRVLRNTNAAGFNEYIDVFATSMTDYGDGGTDWGPWTLGNTVSPSLIQTGPSVQWNGTGTGQTNNIGTTWGVVDAIAIAIQDLSDTGPFDLYLDNLQNGTTIFQDFEGFCAGQQDAVFSAPRSSGSTSGNLLSAPNQAVASNEAADTGTKSLRAQFQWSSTNQTSWVRWIAYGVDPRPLVNLFDPVSLRMLLLPVGATPVAPPAPSLDIQLVNGEVVLDWEGTHALQAADDVLGSYTNVIDCGQGPYTNTPTGDTRFFRLAN